VYKFELSVTDNNGATGRDTMQVTVSARDDAQYTAANISPKANAGTITDADIMIINTVRENNLKVYPNPVIDNTTLDITITRANSKLLIIITDMQGKIVYKNELVATQNNIKEKINMSNLPKGIYAVTVYFNEKEKQTLKVIK
jgi:hypothetical protein